MLNGNFSESSGTLANFFDDLLYYVALYFNEIKAQLELYSASFFLFKNLLMY